MSPLNNFVRYCKSEHTSGKPFPRPFKYTIGYGTAIFRSIIETVQWTIHCVRKVHIQHDSSYPRRDGVCMTSHLFIKPVRGKALDIGNDSSCPTNWTRSQFDSICIPMYSTRFTGQVRGRGVGAWVICISILYEAGKVSSALLYTSG